MLVLINDPVHRVFIVRFVRKHGLCLVLFNMIQYLIVLILQ